MKMLAKCSQLRHVALKNSFCSEVEDFILTTCCRNVHILLVTLFLSTILHYLNKKLFEICFFLSACAVSHKIHVLYSVGMKVDDFPTAFHFMLFSLQ